MSTALAIRRMHASLDEGGRRDDRPGRSNSGAVGQQGRTAGAGRS